jgi:glycosyltransferase involved in cell wall biosynthesis
MIKYDIPSVSIIMPVRNEAQFIERSLKSVLRQDYPPELMEIMILDGMSEDQTRENIQQIIERQKKHSAAKIPSVVVLDNPSKTVPAALNIGLQRSKGEVIIRVDGHCEIPPHYIRTCVDLLNRTEASNVGGITYSLGETYASQAIAAAVRSPFVIGNARFRYSSKPGYVDTVFPGAWRREVFDQIGRFDERLVRHQDYEFNLRLRNAGGRIYYSPELKVSYYSKTNLKSLAQQYFQYGYWKAQVTKENLKAFRGRHFVPALFVIAIVLGAIASPLWEGFLFIYLGLWALYGLFSLGTSVYLASQNGWRYFPVLPVIFPVIHLSWGRGFWIGLIHSALKNIIKRKKKINN